MAEAEVKKTTSIYNSIYRHGVDSKRRLQIPAKWCPEEPDTEFTLILWPKANEGPCLRVLTPTKMAELMVYINQMPNGDPKKTTLKRVIGSSSVQVTVDKQGRICVPEEMARDAGIKDQAVLIGLLDTFEIWSPERHEALKVSDAVMAQEAFKLME
jgi:MraZ protein